MNRDNPKSLFHISRFKYLKHLAIDNKLSIGGFENWTDKVDKSFLETYADHKELLKGFPKVMCLSSKKSSLMWEVYGKAKDSVLVEFDYETLRRLVELNHDVCLQKIDYINLRDCKVQKELLKEIDRYPFVKRPPYKDECEWRLVSDKLELLELENIGLGDLIKSIIVSPNAPDPEKLRSDVLVLFSSVKRVSKSWLFSNEQLIKKYCQKGK